MRVSKHLNIMYKNKITGLLIIALMVMQSSCTKKDDPVNPDPGGNNPTSSLSADEDLINSFFDARRTKSMSYTVDATIGKTIVTPNGSQIIIGNNSFIDASGDPITGMVDVEVTEYMKPSQMIYGNKPTITNNGEILISAGEYLVSASQGSNEIRLKPKAVSILAPIPAGQRVIDSMGQWSGDTANTAQFYGHNHLNQSTSVTYSVFYNQGVEWNDEGNAGITANGYRLDVPGLDTWVNCDVLANYTGPKTTLLCYMDIFNDSSMYSGATVQPCMMYFKPQGINSVIKFNKYILNAPAGYKGFLSYQNSVPIGETGDFLAITCKNGVYYAEHKTNVTIAAPDAGNDYTTLNFNLQQVSAAQLASMINSMDQ